MQLTLQPELGNHQAEQCAAEGARQQHDRRGDLGDRQTRADDRVSEAAMEDRKKAGYF